jgi:hypothetical protein
VEQNRKKTDGSRNLWSRTHASENLMNLAMVRQSCLEDRASHSFKCSQTKVIKAKGTKKVPWHKDKIHQRAFDRIKATIAKEMILAYPDYSKVFEIYTDLLANSLEQSLLRITGLLHSSVRNSPLCNANTVSPKLNY